MVLVEPPDAPPVVRDPGDIVTDSTETSSEADQTCSVGDTSAQGLPFVDGSDGDAGEVCHDDSMGSDRVTEGAGNEASTDPAWAIPRRTMPWTIGLAVGGIATLVIGGGLWLRRGDDSSAPSRIVGGPTAQRIDDSQSSLPEGDVEQPARPGPPDVPEDQVEGAGDVKVGEAPSDQAIGATSGVGNNDGNGRDGTPELLNRDIESHRDGSGDNKTRTDVGGESSGEEKTREGEGDPTKPAPSLPANGGSGRTVRQEVAPSLPRPGNPPGVLSETPHDSGDGSLQRLANLIGGNVDVNDTGRADPGPERGDQQTAKLHHLDTSSAARPVERNDSENRALRDRVERRLGLQVQQLTVEKQSLAEVLRTLSRLADVPFDLDPDGVQLTGVDLDATINEVYRNESLGNILTQLLRPYRLLYRAGPGYVDITAAGGDESGLQRVDYRVGDLVLGNGEVMEWLSQIIPRLIEPNSWAMNGGRGALSIDAEQLAIEQRPELHWQILSLLERLRVAADLPRLSKYDGARFVLGCRSLISRDAMRRPIRYFQRTPARLNDVVSHLAAAAGMNVLVDHSVWAEISFDDLPWVGVAAEDDPFVDVLSSVLPDKLSCRYVAPRLVQITSAHVARFHSVVEVYQCPNRLRQLPPATLQAQIADVVASELGQPVDIASIAVGNVVPAILVRSPQRAQEAVATWLETVAVAVK